MFKSNAASKNVTLALETSFEVKHLNADRHRLEQIISNLLSNAVKFSHQDGIVILKMSTIINHGKKDHSQPLLSPVLLSITVTDNGIGIAPEKQHKLFTPFTQCDNSITRSHAGTGLGLHLTAALAKLMGCEHINVTSEQHKGSTFSLNLHVHEARRHADSGHHENQHNMDNEDIAIMEKVPTPQMIFAVTKSKILVSSSDTLLENTDISISSNKNCKFSERGGLTTAVLNTKNKLEKGVTNNENGSCEGDGISWIKSFEKNRHTDSSATSLHPSMQSSSSTFKGTKPCSAMPQGTSWITSFEKTRQNRKQINDDTNEQFSHQSLNLSIVTNSHCTTAAVRSRSTPTTPTSPMSQSSRKSWVSLSSVSSRGSASMLKGYRVLLVDDSSMIRRITSRMLSNYGCDVTTANDGQEAVDIISTDQTYHCVLMDFHMPVMDGVTATRIITDRFGKAAPPVIGLTADIADSVRHKFLNRGATAIALKPCAGIDLFNLVCEHGKVPNSG
jgi:CheY-like chemotaxis protein